MKIHLFCGIEDLDISPLIELKGLVNDRVLNTLDFIDFDTCID